MRPPAIRDVTLNDPALALYITVQLDVYHMDRARASRFCCARVKHQRGTQFQGGDARNCPWRRNSPGQHRFVRAELRSGKASAPEAPARDGNRRLAISPGRGLE